MNLTKELKKAGLSNTEILIYLYLLENGVSTPPQISKGVNMLRTNTYSVLLSLQEKNLVSKQPKGKRSVYFANDPSAVVAEFEKRKKVVESILPDLRALYKKEKNESLIEVIQL